MDAGADFFNWHPIPKLWYDWHTAPMKTDKSAVFLLIVLVGIVAFLINHYISHVERPIPLAQGWSQPVVVTSSKDSLVGGFKVYKWHDTILGLQGLNDATARCFLEGRSSNAWLEMHLTGVPNGYYWAYPAIDRLSDTAFFDQGYTDNNKLVLKIIVGQLKDQIALKNAKTKQWTLTKDEFFGKDNVRFTKRNEPGKHGWLRLGVGLITGSRLYIPFCVDGFTYNERGNATDRGPNVDGVFRSDNSGEVWQMERIADFEAFNPSMVQTSGHYYYFAAGLVRDRNGWKLWFSHKAVNSDSWDAPKVLTKTFAYGTLGRYETAVEGDTVHICWMDSRHDRWRFSIDSLPVENDDVYYCRRKDSDSSWSKNVLLSKGIEYCYSPSISAEGNKVVVVWAGIPNAGKDHTDYDPNDIFYVTSKDGGTTWSKPLKVTDGAKDGLTAGRPQVVLLNGVIHLLYIQGKMNLKELSPGLVKLNQPPWPIYYTQRPFPN